MKQKLLYYTKEILTFFIVLTILTNLLSLYKSQDLNKSPLPIKSVNLLDSTHYTLPKDKPILIHFWATWCPTCKMEADNIQRLSQSYNVLTIAVKSGNDNEISKYLKEHNLSFKVVNDKDGSLAQLFHISGYPTTFIYNKQHQLTFSEVGYTSSLGLYIRMWWASL
jgi:thiol-disulfide isomerase/thioredoxin